jgi:diacylglycerol kinase family enzyme
MDLMKGSKALLHPLQFTSPKVFKPFRPKSATLIANPTAGGGSERLIKEAYNLLVDRDIEVELFYTDHKGHAETIARGVARGLEVRGTEDLAGHIVIVAGGDGTYNEVANGLVHTQIPMAILPMGTTSVLAREIKIPLNIERAVETITEGVLIEANLGLIECYIQSQKTRRYFLLMAGIGFDGDTVRAVATDKKKKIGKLAYILQGFKQFVHYTGYSIQIQMAENRFITGRPDAAGPDWAILDCGNIIIGKGAHYGGPFTITADASLLDNTFFAFATKGKSRLDILRQVIWIVLNRHQNLPDSSYFEARRMYIEGDAPIQIDGDYIGTLPANLTVAERALRLLVGRLFLNGKY